MFNINDLIRPRVPMGLRNTPSIVGGTPPMPDPFGGSGRTGSEDFGAPGFGDGEVSASAHSTGGGPGRQGFDFSKGVPASFVQPFVESGYGGVVRNETDSNANSYGSKFGQQNANSYANKFGGGNDPDAQRQYNTPIPVDVWSRSQATGQTPTWSGGQWHGPNPEGASRGGPNYASDPRYAGQVGQLNQTYQTILQSLMNGGYPGQPNLDANSFGRSAALNSLLQRRPEWS